MKMFGFAVLFISLSLLFTTGAQARNDAHFFSIQDAVKTAENRSSFSKGIKFYFADQPHPAVEATLSQGVVAYKKGSISDRTEVEACNRTFLAALAQLQARARKVGGNAIINIESYYKKTSFKSNDQYECRVGSARTGVMLRGDIVKLKN